VAENISTYLIVLTFATAILCVLQQQQSGEMDAIDKAEAATSSVSEDEEDPKKEHVPDIKFLFGLKSDFAKGVVEILQYQRQDLLIEVLSYK